MQIPASLRSDFIHIASEQSIHIVGIRSHTGDAEYLVTSLREIRWQDRYPRQHIRRSIELVGILGHGQVERNLTAASRRWLAESRRNRWTLILFGSKLSLESPQVW